MAPRLKVFVTSDGLTDYVVATSSRAKALAAWGVRQDLFKEGQAWEADDPALAETAKAQPETVLRRPAGSRDRLAKLKPAVRPKPSTPSKAALKKISDLEAKLERLGARRDAKARDIEARREALAREAEGVDADYAREREALEDALKAAKQALR